MKDSTSRWVVLALNVFLSGFGAWYTAYLAGARGILALGPTVITAGGVLKAGIDPSPRSQEPVQTTIVNPPDDPVPTTEVKP